MATLLEKRLTWLKLSLPTVNFLIYWFEVRIPGDRFIETLIGSALPSGSVQQGFALSSIDQFFILLKLQFIVFGLMGFLAIFRYARMPRGYIKPVLPATRRLLSGSLFFLFLLSYTIMSPESVALENNDPKLLGGGYTALILMVTISLTFAAAPIIAMAIAPTKVEWALIKNRNKKL